MDHRQQQARLVRVALTGRAQLADGGGGATTAETNLRTNVGHTRISAAFTCPTAVAV